MTKIIVNGREHQVKTGVVSYSLIVELAGGKPTKLDYTVTYRSSFAPTGTLTRGDIMEVFDGMIFNAVVTGAA